MVGSQSDSWVESTVGAEILLFFFLSLPKSDYLQNICKYCTEEEEEEDVMWYC